MIQTAIKGENLGKKFLIGHQKSGDLRQTFGQTVRRILKQDVHRNEDFWALKDLSFEIKRGEVVGIIGRNGAGKSTLLKILSRITDPSAGRFEIDGRVSSLLEVGTGFHMELSGRENIFLNGTILGMKRAEIRRKFDEIVAFSGIENFIDTPVKHYSSGMKVRLAFSVAAHLEPEILIIDEVLAVGDAEFQKRCLGKMDEVSQQEGRTILFVSHNLAAVSQLCRRGFLLRDGKLVSSGQVADVIHDYITHNKEQVEVGTLGNLDLRKGNGQFRVTAIELKDAQACPITVIRTGSAVNFHIKFNKKIHHKQGFRIDLAIDNEHDMRIGWFSSEAIVHQIGEEFQEIIFRIQKFPYSGGRYFLTFYATMNSQIVDYIHQAFSFDVEDGDFFGTGRVIPKKQTFFYLDYEMTSQ